MSSGIVPAPLPSSARLPLTSRAAGDVLFRQAAGEPVTAARFLRDVALTAERLPDRRYALNLCSDRYHFLVAFAAALVRGQVSLLSSDRAPHRLEQLASAYPEAYTIGGGSERLPGVEHAPLLLEGTDGGPATVPELPATQLAALVLTSGSTGEPMVHPKPWETLVACSEAASDRFGFAGPVTASVVGTVPPQHMYGFETTVLLPLHANVSSYAGPTFFPYDIAQALARATEPRVLVTTPLQMRTLLQAGQPLPALAMVISATAPLAPELAQAAEAAWGTEVHEIFGATEVGSMASRRTVEGDRWRAYRTVRLRPEEDEAVAVSVPGLSGEVVLADRVEVLDEGSFRLLGRRADLIKLAGKRASLAGLNAILCGIEGVQDGTFFAPDDLDSNPRARLSTFVVAPERSPDAILADLRARIEAPFLPRRVVKVDRLPRNDVGKIPLQALQALHRGGAG
jgi:acyl-coenzyme A synthetase/AMP-(fatty) acid ligase